jgi:hypothetical protein
MDITEKIKQYLLEQEVEDDQEEVEVDEEGGYNTNKVFGQMIDLICSLDPDSLNDEQGDLLGDILDDFGLLGDYDEDDEEPEELDGEDYISEKKIQKIKRSAHLKAHKAYKKKRMLLLKQAARFRKTGKYKMWMKKHKRMVKAGKTKHKKYV